MALIAKAIQQFGNASLIGFFTSNGSIYLATL